MSDLRTGLAISRRVGEERAMPKDARRLAINAHGDQRYGTEPYVVHLDEVVGILREYGYDDDVTIAAGYLHDALEDTELPVGVLSMVGAGVVCIVTFCTDEHGPNRSARKAKTYDRMRRFIVDCRDRDLIAKCVRVKLADRLANLRRSTLMSMYKREAAEFRAALYYPGAADAMWAEFDALCAD